MKKLHLVFALLVLSPCAIAQNSVILSAMKDELKRSIDELRLDREAGPYYLSYQVRDIHTLRITADSGAITVNSSSRSRTLKTDLRVGDYAMDNSNFLSMGSMSGFTAMLAAGMPITVDDDYSVIRRQIWQATDRAYKAALETLAKKKAALQNTVQNEALPDFTKGEAASSLLPEISQPIAGAQWERFVDQLSKLFTGNQKVYRSKVDLKMLIVNSYYANSEGTEGIEPSAATRLSISASTQADDGMPIGKFLVFTAQRPEGLPQMASLEVQVRTMIADLLATRTAPLAQDYSGPVLFETQAAAELLGQGLGNFLLAKRTPVSDNPQFNAMFGRMENPFLGKLNARVAPSFLSVKAVPSLKEFEGKPFLGLYALDDEGVKCREVDLIENGILKNLLTSRAPVKGFSQSNGYGRGGSPVAGVIRVISSKKVPNQGLKQELIKAVKDENLPYGYVVRGLTPVPESMDEEQSIESILISQQQGPPEPSQFRLTKPYSVFRIYPDGKEELVRGVDFSSLSVNTFKNIMATSEQEIAYDYPANVSRTSTTNPLLALLGGAGMAGPDYYATVITPSLLIGGIDVGKSSGAFQKPPFVAAPVKQ